MWSWLSWTPVIRLPFIGLGKWLTFCSTIPSVQSSDPINKAGDFCSGLVAAFQAKGESSTHRDKAEHTPIGPRVGVQEMGANSADHQVATGFVESQDRA